MNCLLDPQKCVAQGIADGIGALAKSFSDGASWAVTTMTTAWLGAPSPDVTSAGSPTLWLESQLSYFVLVAMFCSILYAAYRMATTGQFEHAADLAHSLGRLIVVGGCAGVATAIALQVGDAVAAWALAGARVSVSGWITLAAINSPAVVLLLALVVILAQVVQLGIMLVKNAMVVALVAFLPLTAAATNTPTGKGGYQKALTWLGAFVLYKPVAAIIYALAFKMTNARHTIADQLSGIALMLLAIFALPALMRFLVPATASVTGGNAGALAGAVVGAGLATGAIIATGGASAAAGGFSSAAPSGAVAAAPSGAPASPPGAGLGGEKVTGALNAGALGVTAAPGTSDPVVDQ